MSPNGFSKEALDHAWSWFSVHATQRMQSFHFFLIATAFLVAAYGAVLEEHPRVAVGIAVLGAWISYWFNRLEKRTKQLVKAGELALEPLQQRLVDLTGIPDIAMLHAVEEKARGSSSYAVVINTIEWTTLLAFLSAAVYAVLRFVRSG